MRGRGPRGRGRQGRVGRLGDAGSGGRRRRRRRRSQRSSPDSSTATRTSCSRASGRPSSRPAWRASATPAAGSPATVSATRAATDDELRGGRSLAPRRDARRSARRRSRSRAATGSTVADEARMLRIARELTPETTFLGAHVVPSEYASDRAGYLTLVRGEMLAACAPFARWVDVFCDEGAFDADEARVGARRGCRGRPDAATARQPARLRARRAARRRGPARRASTTARI